jgi:hypothetical protein
VTQSGTHVDSSATIEGPAWTGKGLDESAGRYPLSVEGAVFRLVDQLLPGIITTTRQARMYSVHALAWADARERGLDSDETAAFVRRCEVVTAAIHHLHQAHRRRLKSAHGEDRIKRFIGDEGLAVRPAAELDGMSAAGFANVYLGPTVKVGLLSPDRPPRAGERSDLGALRGGLAGLCELAERETVPVAELEAAGHLCLCAGAESSDGEHLRRILFEDAEEDRHEDRYRQLTCHMLLEAIGDQNVDDVDAVFRERWGFGPLLTPISPIRAHVGRGWRAAILRNYSVGAWRALWRWLAARLAEEPMTVEKLGLRLIAELDDVSLAELVADLPARADGDSLIPLERDLEAEEWTPMVALRMLILGAKRLEDLDEETAALFIGTDHRDLGPRWVAARLREGDDDGLDVFARDLVEILIRRAKRVALGKMRLRDGKPWVPSRLRDRDGLLTAHGEEGAGHVSLRTGSLTEILVGLGALTRDGKEAISATPLGLELRERTA